jgi:hypothetical protein
MPFAPIPLRIVEIGVNPLPVAFHPVRGQFPLQPILGPSLVEHFQITSFYLPLSVYGVNLSAPNPAQAWITVKLLLSGEVAFAQEINPQLMAMGPGGSITPRANALIVGQPYAPIVYRSGQGLVLSYELYFDQTLSPGCLSELALGGIYDPSSTAPSGMEAAAGSIGYSIVSEPEVLVAQ